MRGYFGIGCEHMSKAMNAGALFRSAHAFGASFVFTVDASFTKSEVELADTSKAFAQLPYYEFPSLAEMTLPKGCALVGVELTEGAETLPSFRHPESCAYVLGPERGELSPQMAKACDFVVKIPTAFCVNVAVAGAIVMYDRMVSLGRFPLRPVAPGAPSPPWPKHIHGEPVSLRQPRPEKKSKSGKKGAKKKAGSGN